jgi:hypothetical protein
MGEPDRGNTLLSRKGGNTRRTEPSKYPEEEKTKCYSLSSGERNGNSPNLIHVITCMCCV